MSCAANETGSKKSKGRPRGAMFLGAVVVKDPPKWYDDKEDHSPWIKALVEVRSRATCEGWCHQHVQSIAVAIDQYAEAAFGNRQFFLNKPYGIGGSRNDNIP